MRRMSLLIRTSWWCLLGLAAAMGAGAARAQEAAAAAQEKDQAPVVVVFTNTTKKVGMSKMQAIAKVQNENVKVCRVVSIEGDPTAVLITGLSPGRSRVTFEDTKKQMETIEVEVVDASLEQIRKEFLEQIPPKVPGAQLTIQLTSRGAILSGTVPDQASLKTVTDAARNFFGERITFALQLPEAVKGRFVQQIERAIPGSKINVFIDGGNILVAGYAPDQTSVRAIEASARNAFGPETVVAVSIAGQEPAARIPRVQQVELEVLVAVVNRSEVRNMSFNWIINKDSYFVSSIINAPLAFSNALTAGIAGGSATATATGSNLTFGVVGDKGSFTGFLQALRTEGLAKILSEPRIVTLSGQRAKILSGGETPVLTTSGQGSPTIEYKPFGTEVNFTPVVLENSRIQIEVVALLSNRNDANGIFIGGATPTQIPGFDTREVRSTIQLEDSQTLAIGGLIQNKVNAAISKIPLLGDIPFLGVAFSSTNFREEEEEMLILVTPRLVEPMACCQLPRYLPGRETRVADDFELFLTQILEAPRGPREVCPDGRFVAAHKNGPTAAMFPCGDNSAGHGGHGWYGRCGAGGCGVGHGLFHKGHGCGRAGCVGCANGTCNGNGNGATQSTPSHLTPAGYQDAASALPLPQGEPIQPVEIRDDATPATAIPIVPPPGSDVGAPVVPQFAPAGGYQR
jgi:Flp pilus assembly secretin CpaC